MELNFPSNMKFMLTGHGGFYNRGCEAIVRSTIDLLESKFNKLEFSLYSLDSENDKNLIEHDNIHVYPYPFPRFTKDWFMYGALKRIPKLGSFLAKNFGSSYYKANACLCMGGDNYTLDYGFPDGLILLDQLIMKTGIPVVIWGASIGPFESDSYVKTRMQEHLKSVDLITARESLTVEYLKSLGITKNVVHVNDPAFYLTSEMYTGPESSFMNSDNILGINVSPLIVKWRYDKSIKSLINEIASFVDFSISEGLKVLLVPHVIKEGSDIIKNDEAILSMILKSTSNNEDSILLLPKSLNARTIKWFISKCRFFIGARTHSTIAAISSGVPTISIAYSQKARGINQDIFGNEKYVLETPLVSKSTLIDKLNILKKRESTICKLLRDMKSEMISNAEKNADFLAEIIDKKNNQSKGKK